MTTPFDPLPRVLVADDNEAMLTRTVALLRGICDIVGTARDGRAAIELATALKPDVIVLDISMPGHNGLEVAAALRRQGSAVAIVFVSAHDDAEFIEVAQSAGALGYVFKPRLTIDLAEAVLAASAGRAWFPTAS